MWFLFVKDDFTLSNMIDQKISDCTNFVGDALTTKYFNNSGLQKHNSFSFHLNLCGFTKSKNCSNLNTVCLWPDPPKSLTLISVMKALKGCLNLEVCMIERTSNRTGY